MKNRVDILAFKMESFDTEDFIKELISYSRDCIILVVDFDKMVIKYKPQNVSFQRNVFEFHKTKSNKLNNLILPFLFLLDILLLIRIFAAICFKYRPRICWIENLYVTFIIGILKKFHLCGKLISLSSDWLVNPAEKRLWSYIANNLLFPFLDYFGWRLSDVVLYGDERLAQARYRFWGRNIAKRKKMFSPICFPGLSLKINNSDRARNAICFLGDMRLDSGLDIAIKALFDIRKQEGIVLKIIGPQRQNYEYFKKLTTECRLEAYVEFFGFIEAGKLREILDDCFCGINILTSLNSYSNYAIPGKQIHYLQFLLPIIATEDAGILVPVIKEKALGIIIEPTQVAFKNSIIKVYKDQVEYRKNIINFINNIQRINIKELIEA